jgi:hypothetical protein
VLVVSLYRRPQLTQRQRAQRLGTRVRRERGGGRAQLAQRAQLQRLPGDEALGGLGGGGGGATRRRLLRVRGSSYALR